jgi:hypothetical protein
MRVGREGVESGGVETKTDGRREGHLDMQRRRTLRCMGRGMLRKPGEGCGELTEPMNKTQRN